MSQRIIICGVSESGKSALAKHLTKDSPIPVFIRDPVGASDWPRCDALFYDSDELRVLLEKQKSAPCIALIDEGADFFTVGKKENHWIFTRGRHFGMLPIVVCHYVKAMAPIVRDQATDLYVFESSIETSKILADSYNMPELENAHELIQGEFFHVKRVDGKRTLTQHTLFRANSLPEK